MESFIFNGYKSYEDLSIVVKEMPPVSRAEKNIETIKVNGRNGNLHIDNKTYNSKSYTIQCVLLDSTKIDLIKSVFHGTGILTLSTEPNREYNATIKNQIDFSKYLTFLKEFPLQFDVDPFSFSNTLQTKEFTSSSNFNVGGTIEVNPTLIISGIGTITLNNIQINVTESDITIDCDLMECVKNNTNKSDKVNLEQFPKLLVGQNTINIGDGITKVIIKYKEGWL